MPSINRPNWQGVTISSEQCTLNYITENLRSLQRSTALIRENLTNWVGRQNSENDIFQITLQQIPNADQNCNLTLSNMDNESLNTDNIIQDVQESLARNKEMKLKTEKMLLDNVSFKQDIQIYLKESAEWRQKFAEDLHYVISLHKSSTGYSLRKLFRGGNVKATWESLTSGTGQVWNSLKQRYDAFDILDAFLGNDLYSFLRFMGPH